MTDDALALSLDALTATTSTVPQTVRPAASNAPKGWEPGVKYRGDGSMEVTSMASTDNVQGAGEAAWRQMVANLGLEIPHGFVVRLVEAKYDPAAWHRDTEFVTRPDGEVHNGNRWTKAPAVTRPVWRYKFAVEPDSKRVHADDVDRIIAEVLRKRRKTPAVVTTGQRRSLNIVYADPQAGKTAILGGTQELANRVGECFDLLTDHIRDLKKVGRGPTEAAWLDGGDCIEGFENVKSQQFTNDLTLTQQVRTHRRITLYGLDWLAGRFGEVKAATCGSNHARVRAGKDPLGPPDDDWGIEIMSQVQDAYARNSDAYGHVQFAYPPKYRDTLCIDLGGLPVGLAHGHQVSRPEGIPGWWKGQIFGSEPITDARVLVTGHFHHFAAKEVGDGRLWLQAPTMDGGSDWFTMTSGEQSLPGMLVFSTTEDGWDDVRIIRPTVTQAKLAA